MPDTADPIVAEIREGREEHARRFNFDVRAIVEELRRAQEARGRKLVKRPPRRLLEDTA